MGSEVTKSDLIRIWTSLRKMKKDMIELNIKNEELERRIAELENKSSVEYDSDDSFYLQKTPMLQETTTFFDELEERYVKK